MAVRGRDFVGLTVGLHPRPLAHSPARPCTHDQAKLDKIDNRGGKIKGDGLYEWGEFLELYLVKLGHMTEDGILELRNKFEEIDVDKSGTISQSEILAELMLSEVDTESDRVIEKKEFFVLCQNLAAKPYVEEIYPGLAADVATDDGMEKAFARTSKNKSTLDRKEVLTFIDTYAKSVSTARDDGTLGPPFDIYIPFLWLAKKKGAKERRGRKGGLLFISFANSPNRAHSRFLLFGGACDPESCDPYRQRPGGGGRPSQDACWRQAYHGFPHLTVRKATFEPGVPPPTTQPNHRKWSFSGHNQKAPSFSLSSTGAGRARGHWRVRTHHHDFNKIRKAPERQ